MYNIKCDYCSRWLSSVSEKHEHEIKEHNLFKNTDTNIIEETIGKLRKTMARVKWLLESYPSTRGDDRILILMYLRLFEKHLVYNDATKLIEFRNRQGVSYEDWRNISSFETITRCRRKIVEQFPELKPTLATILKRRERAKAFKSAMPTLTYSKSDYQKI